MTMRIEFNCKTCGGDLAKIAFVPERVKRCLNCGAEVPMPSRRSARRDALENTFRSLLDKEPSKCTTHMI